MMEYSPSSTIDANDDTIKTDNLFLQDTSTSPFNPLPPPPIHFNPHGNSRQNSIQSNGSGHLDNESHDQSIFSNSLAMSSVNSIHDGPHHYNSDFYYSTTAYNSSNDLLYSLTDYELGNPSFESIPDAVQPDYPGYVHSLGSSAPTTATVPITATAVPPSAASTIPQLPPPGSPPQSHAPPAPPPFHSAPLNGYNYPYTPTLNDVYTPTFTDSSFTPGSINDEFIRNSTSSLVKQSPIINTNPMSTPSSKHKPAKPTSRNGKPNSMVKPLIQSNLSIHTDDLQKVNGSTTNISEYGLSPLCNKYNHLELSGSSTNSTPIKSPNHPGQLPFDMLPQTGAFRHKSDSSNNSMYAESPKGPRRKPAPVGLKEKPLKSRLTKKTSKSSLVDHHAHSPIGDTKPKKHTRRRLLPRSKEGCWICRIKHLKCDESKPSCSSCIKYGIACDYSPDKPGYVIDKNLRKEKLIEISQIRKQNSQTRPRSLSKVLSKIDTDIEYNNS